MNTRIIREQEERKGTIVEERPDGTRITTTFESTFDREIEEPIIGYTSDIESTTEKVKEPEKDGCARVLDGAVAKKMLENLNLDIPIVDGAEVKTRTRYNPNPKPGQPRIEVVPVKVEPKKIVIPEKKAVPAKKKASAAKKAAPAKAKASTAKATGTGRRGKPKGALNNKRLEAWHEEAATDEEYRQHIIDHYKTLLATGTLDMEDVTRNIESIIKREYLEAIEVGGVLHSIEFGPLPNDNDPNPPATATPPKEEGEDKKLTTKILETWYEESATKEEYQWKIVEHYVSLLAQGTLDMEDVERNIERIVKCEYLKEVEARNVKQAIMDAWNDDDDPNPPATATPPKGEEPKGEEPVIDTKPPATATPPKGEEPKINGSNNIDVHPSLEGKTDMEIRILLLAQHPGYRNASKFARDRMLRNARRTGRLDGKGDTTTGITLEAHEECDLNAL